MAESLAINRQVRILEEDMDDLRKALASVQHKLGQSAQDQAQQQAQQQNRPAFYRAQAVGAIGASSGNALGTGTARLLQLVGGSRFKRLNDAGEAVTVPVVNDTGGTIPDKTYLILAVVDGRWTVIVGDCATTTPADAPDPSP